MNYEEALSFINETKKLGSVLGLQNITELLKRLNNPQDKLKFVHIAGTNGKGSTSAFIGNILATAGYTVGRYISPVVFEYRESIQISKVNDTQNESDCSYDERKNIDKEDNYNEKNENGEKFKIITTYIKEKAVATYITQIQEVCNCMTKDGLAHPTPFEIETAMAFLCFLDEDCDIVVLETGLGGRLDATNVITTTICAVLTGISMDHMQFLGDTIDKIAVEKAGIIKKDIVVASYEQVLEARHVINQVCKEQNSIITYTDFNLLKNISHSLECVIFDYGNDKKLKIRLLGENQVKNAAVAIEAVKLIKTLGYTISDHDIRAGLLSTSWPGRFQIIKENPILVVDGAHNEDAAISLAKSIKQYFAGKRIIYIIGVLADKDYESIVKHTAYLADVIITVTPNNDRALSSDKLAQIVKSYHGHVIDGKNIQHALMMAEEMAKDEDIIISFGSLSYLGDIHCYYKR